MIPVNIEEQLALILRVVDNCESYSESRDQKIIKEQLDVIQKEKEMDLIFEPQICCAGEKTKTRRYEKRIKKKKSGDGKWYKKCYKLILRLFDMRIAGSCRQSVSVPAVLWTSVILLSLASGVCYASEEPIRNERSTSAEIQGYPSPDAQETYTLYNIFREMKALIEQQMLQKQQQQLQQQANEQVQAFNNGEGLSEGGLEYEKLPSPQALLGRSSFYDEGSKEDTKRGSYMSLCHFKICNMGRKRSGMRWIQRYRK